MFTLILFLLAVWHVTQCDCRKPDWEVVASGLSSRKVLDSFNSFFERNGIGRLSDLSFVMDRVKSGEVCQCDNGIDLELFDSLNSTFHTALFSLDDLYYARFKYIYNRTIVRNRTNETSPRFEHYDASLDDLDSRVTKLEEQIASTDYNLNNVYTNIVNVIHSLNGLTSRVDGYHPLPTTTTATTVASAAETTSISVVYQSESNATTVTYNASETK